MSTDETSINHERVARADLEALRDLIPAELERFLLTSAGKYSVYRNRLIAVCLCQDAARNFVSGDARVNDLDVWFFFAEDVAVKFPNFRNLKKSAEGIFPTLGMKRVDFMKKAIPTPFIMADDVVATLANFLLRRGTGNAKKLSAKPVIGLWPEQLFAVVLWQATTEVSL